MPKISFQNYLWVIDKLRARPMTLAQLAREYEASSLCEPGKTLSDRTFRNWRGKIEEMFGLSFDCNSRNEYFMVGYDQLESNSYIKWLLQSFSVSRQISEGKSLTDRILLEDIPSGEKYLGTIVDAMRRDEVIRFTYETFEQHIAHVIEIEPWCVKVNAKRWYVFGKVLSHSKDPEGEFPEPRVFALDRMSACSSVEGRTFTMPEDFSPKAFFSEYYGVYVYTPLEVTDVRIRVAASYRQYLYTLPLHCSQTEVEKTDDYSVFSYRLRPTVDFCRVVLAIGNQAEVLSPGWLKEEFAAQARLMVDIYKTH